jgi:hypothetical protein
MAAPPLLTVGHVGWSEIPFLFMIPMYPELRCPVLCSENEEVEKRAHFLELPTGHQFPFKGTKDKGERRPVGISQ